MRWLLFALITLSLSVSSANAYPVNFYASQVSVDLPYINIYTRLVDETGESIQITSIDNINAKVDDVFVLVTDLKQFADSGKPVTYTLVVDVSKTMAGEPFRKARDDLSYFVRNMKDSDCLSIITFGDDVSVISDFTSDKDTLISKLGEMIPNHSNTHLFDALSMALNLNKRNDDKLSDRRVILLITDGKDEGSGITVDDIIQKNDRIYIPIYSIGYTQIDQQYQDVLKRLSGLTDAAYLNGSGSEESNPFKRIVEDINSHIYIQLNYPDAKADSSKHLLSLTSTSGTKQITFNRDIYFLKSDYPTPQTPTPTQIATSVPEPKNRFNKYIFPLLALVMLVAVIIAIIAIKMKKKGYPIKADDNLTDKNQHTAVDNTNAVKTGTIFHMSENMKSAVGNPVINEEYYAKLTLYEIDANKAGQTFTLPVGSRKITIGRMNADVSLPKDTEISRIHCSLMWVNDRLLIQDEGSLNGTKLNGIPIRTREIVEDGSTIEVGGTTIRIEVKR